MDGEKTVVLLGAGASYASDFHLPVMRGFWPSFADLPSPLAEFLAWLYPNGEAECNLEEALAYLELARDRASTWALPMTPSGVHPDQCYSTALDDVRSRLLTPPGKTCAQHVNLFHALEPGDTVITMNYDLIADEALKVVEIPSGSRLGKLKSLIGTPNFIGVDPPSLLPHERQTGFYLKLHGSLDWLRCRAPACPNHNRLFPVRVQEMDAEQSPGSPCRLCGAALEVFIVPPMASKRVDQRGRLGFLWNLAMRELMSASQVITVGLSLAPSDFELRWLLQASTLKKDLKRVRVANPSPEVRQATYRLLRGPSTQCIDHNGLSELLSAICAPAVAT